MVFYDSPQKVFALIISSFVLGAVLALLFDLVRFARTLVFLGSTARKRKMGIKVLGTIGLFISDFTLFVFFALVNVVFFSYRCSGRIRADCLVSEALAVFLYYIIIGKRTKKLEERSASAIREKLLLPPVAFAKKKYDILIGKVIAKRRAKESRRCEKVLISNALGGFGADLFIGALKKEIKTDTDIEKRSKDHR